MITKLTTSVLFFAVCSGLLLVQRPAQGQLVLDVKIAFSKGTSNFTPPFRVNWIGGTIIGNDIVTLPNGVQLGMFDNLLLDTFEEFQEAVVGTWTVQLNNGMLTFEIAGFESEDFPSLIVSAPVQGEQFFCNEIIVVEAQNKSAFDQLGLLIAGQVGASIVFSPPSGFRAILDDDLELAELDIFRTGSLDNGKLISNIQGDVDLVPLDPEIWVQTQSNPVTINVVQNPNLGDINGDGAVDQLDVGPFIDGLLAGVYIFDGDVNKDLRFDLSDIAPFVELISSD